MRLYEKDYTNPNEEERKALKEQDEFIRKGIVSPEHVDPIKKYKHSIREFATYYRMKFPNNIIWHNRLLYEESEIEAKKLEGVIENSTLESDVQNYIKSNRKWLIPASILKGYNFGHKENYLFPEMRLGSKMVVDYGICGRNSNGYHLILVEFESPSSKFLTNDMNRLDKSVNSGLGQIENWKIWMSENRQMFLNEHGFTENKINIPIERIFYCLVVSRRSEMNYLSRSRKDRIMYEHPNLEIINYNRICDYVLQLSAGYSTVSSIEDFNKRKRFNHRRGR